MKTSQLLTVAVAALGFTSQAIAQDNNRFGGNNNNNNNADNNNAGNDNAGNANDLALLADNVQAASNSAGQPDEAAGQSNSNTDPANFINVCTGKTLTNGKQVTQGSCNGVTMGDIPSNNNMLSTVVLFPGPGEDIQADQQFNVQVQINNLEAGSFTDPINTYYSAPQALAGNGNIIGHCHVTIQDLNGDVATKTPPDPKNFAFFKGINDAGDGNGLLQAVVTDGLPAGSYRVCTMNSASNHQPVLMPVAQRGAQDDCNKFTVGQGNGGAGNGQGGNNGGAGNAGAGNGQGNGQGNADAGNGQGNGQGNADAGNGQGNGQGNADAGNGQGGDAASTATDAAATATDAAATATDAAATTTAAAGDAAASTTAASAAATTTAAANGGGNGFGRGGRTGGRFGRGRFGRGRFTARDFVA